MIFSALAAAGWTKPMADPTPQKGNQCKSISANQPTKML